MQQQQGHQQQQRYQRQQKGHQQQIGRQPRSDAMRCASNRKYDGKNSKYDNGNISYTSNSSRVSRVSDKKRGGVILHRLSITAKPSYGSA
jgi:hypothetical protein